MATSDGPAPSDTRAPDLVWKREAFINSADRYRKLIGELSTHPRAICAVSQLLDLAEMDAAATCLVNVFTATDSTLTMINELLWDEFKRTGHAALTGSLLRGSGLLNKMESAFVRKIGTDYLRTVVGDLVAQIAFDSELNLEIDGRKLRDAGASPQAAAASHHGGGGGGGEDAEEQLASNQRLLTDVCQMFLDRITAPELLAIMPRQMRAIAGFTAQVARQYVSDTELLPLIGGFIMLRVFSPAMVTPESSGILDAIPSQRARRNLILIAKILQNCSNGVLFGAKEEYMLCMNDFITRNQQRMNAYLHAVATDPDTPADSPQKPWEALSVPPRRVDVDVKSISLHDLFELHRILETRAARIVAHLRREDATDYYPLIVALTELGPSPLVKRQRNTSGVSASSSSSAASSSSSSSTAALAAIGVGADEGGSGSGSSIGSGPHGLTVDTAALEKARFLFKGPNSKAGRAVVYIIVNRVRLNFLLNADVLTAHIYQVIGDQPYELLIDMSWTTISKTMKMAFFQYLRKASESFTYTYKKNLQAVYIVHPSSYSRAVLFFMRGISSRKFKRKVHEIYNWKDLTKFIDASNIMLPDTSKDYITKAYKVTKVNAKGKSQQRILKFTQNSLLNIDPKGRCIKNEKMLGRIERLSTFHDLNELLMHFADGDPDEEEGAGGGGGSSGIKRAILKPVSSSSSSYIDRVFRRYVCSTRTDRDAIVEDIFVSAFRNRIEPLATPQQFTVTKINVKGKHQERILKFTCDSLLTLDKQLNIKKEVGFAGIEDVRIAADNPAMVILKLKSETFERRVICQLRDAPLLVRGLKDGMQRYMTEDEDEFLRDVDDVANQEASAQAQGV